MFKTIEASVGARNVVILSETPYIHKGVDRTVIKARRPRGTKIFTLVRYADGQFSSAV